MRRIRFALICLAVLLTSCSESFEEGSAGGQGEITIALSSDTDNRIVSKSETGAVPDVGDFKVEIFNSSGVRLYRDTYANSLGKKILLNGGDYTLTAKHGNPLSIGFNAVYYAAEVPFTVHGQTHETIEAVAKMANVKVAVEYGENVRQDYPEHYAKVVSGDYGALEFSAEETRAGYVPAGQLTLELYATIDGVLKYFPSDPIECSPNDFVTFKVDTKIGEGSLQLTVIIDDSVETIEKVMTIPATMLPTDVPTIDCSGLDSSSPVSVIEGVGFEGSLKTDITAMGGIANCWLDINSAALLAAGIPERVDLAHVDSQTAALLAQWGISYLRDMEGQRLAYVDFSKLAKKLVTEKCNPADPFSAVFSLTVIDAKGHQTSAQTYTIEQKAPEFAISAIPEGNVWAKRITGINASVTKGNPQLVKLQYRADGGNWTDAPDGVVSGIYVNFGTLAGLLPSTNYEIRCIYNSNEALTQSVNVTTEAAAQIGNAGFEDWHTESYAYKVTLGGTHYRDWWLPWTEGQSDIWWAVNSKKRMLSECTAANLEYKVFPTISYSTTKKSQGNNSAQIATVATGAWATSGGASATATAGEMWIGTASDGGDHASDGHAFPSRPDVLSFWYQYVPCGGTSETYYVKIELLDVAGTVIASKEVSDGAAESAGRYVSLRLDYSDISKKAASIRLSFKSSTAASPEFKAKQTLEMAGSNLTTHIGSVLRVDDIQLIYE